jgi:hypothetical protein
MTATFAPFIRAEAAGVHVGDVVAHRAVGDAFLHVLDGGAEQVGILARRPQHVVRQALGALGADARQFLKAFDEARQ